MSPMNNRLMRPRASGGTTPAAVAGLQLWLDGADNASLFDADAGGSTVAADGTVGRWQDKSGNLRHFTQGTANNRPTYRTSALNGLSALEFDGSNDNLLGDATQYIKTTSPFSLYAVYRCAADAGNFAYLFSSKSDVTSAWRFGEANSLQTNYQTVHFGSPNHGRFRAGASTTRSNWHVVTLTYNGSLTTEVSNYALTVNNVAQTLVAAGNFGNDAGSTAAVGSRSDLTSLWKGNIAELIVYSSVLSATDNALVMSHLKRWGLH